MQVRAIRSDADLSWALEEIDGLLDAKPGSREDERLEVLSTLVHAFESRHHRPSPPSALDAIAFRMEQMGYSRKDLEPLLGGRAKVSEVLGGKRKLSKAMIVGLHRAWGIPFESLLSD